MKPDNLCFAAGRPLGPLYGLIMHIRRRLYKAGGLRSYAVPVPVISVGNLVLGGAGKTPLVECIVKWGLEAGLAPCILTRGYGGSAGKGPKTLLHGGRLLMGPCEAGDEPYMLAQRLLLWCERHPTSRQPLIIVGADRVEGAKHAVQLGSDLMVLDDGFQHLRLKRDLDILLFPYHTDLDRMKVFPAGALREPLSASRDADLVVVTKTPSSVNHERMKAFSRVSGGKRVITAGYRPKALCSPADTPWKSLDLLRNRRTLAFCGIGDPWSFRDTIEGLGADLVGFVAFRDHYKYTKSDLHRLNRLFVEKKADILLTTEKDMVRLMPILDQGQGSALNGMRSFLFALTIEIDVEGDFFQILNDFMEKQETEKRGEGRGNSRELV